MKKLMDILLEKRRYDGPDLGTDTHPWQAPKNSSSTYVFHHDKSNKYNATSELLSKHAKEDNPHKLYDSAIRSYKASSHTVNKGLRITEGNPDHPYLSARKDMIGQLDKVTSFKTRAPVTVYRGLYHMNDGSEGDVAKKFPKGSIHHDHGFTSTSTDLYTAKEFSDPQIKPYNTDDEKKHALDNEDAYQHGYRTIAKIHVPKGTKGHYLDDNHYGIGGGVKGENEFLLHRGTKFKVTGHSVDKEAKLHWVHMEVHSQENHGEFK